MSRTRPLAVWSVIVAALSGLAAAATAAPLPRDQRILTGKLDNGVTWMYRRHDNPPGKMALLMHVRTGSLNESDAQRGLAHFLEHMVFNGTEHFPPGELIKYFESIGMRFGADLNASTSFDRTAYLLFLPDAKVETVDRGLMTMSDYAFRASLLEEEIDKERPVILEEKRTRQDHQERIRDKLWPELFAGSRLAQRVPIGIEEVIAGAPRSEFVDYYRTWYRPETITVLLVGDAAPEPFIPLIQKWFGDYTPGVPYRSQHDAEFKPFTTERAIVVTDPELARCTVTLDNLRPGRPPTVTREQWRTERVEDIGTWIFGRRCQERIQKGQASYLSARASIHDMFNDGLVISAEARGEPANWAKMLEELIIELHRAREFGFSERELGLAKKEILAGAERAVETEPTRNARRVAFEILAAVNAEVPVLSARQELDLYQEIMPTISLAEVNAAFQEHFKPGTYAYVIEMPEKADVTAPPREDVIAAARAAWARKPEAPKQEEVPAELLASIPKPGQVVETATDSDLDITSAWLENGVRVHHRFMDYKKDSVLVSISLAGGRIEESATNAGITELAALAVNQPATSRLNSTNIRDFMTGKNINVSAQLEEDDAFTITVSGSPKDLETGLQLAHALLTDGRIEPSAADTWKRSRIQRIEQNQTNLRYKSQEALADLLSGGDPRRVFPAKAQIEALKLEDAQTWFTRLCRSAPVEVAVVGQITKDDALALIQTYIGSLPTRPRTAEYLDRFRKLGRETGPLVRQVKVDTMSPQATASVGFVGCEGRSVDDARALQLAANILSSRLVKEIREERALVYSIRASSAPSWTYADSGRFMAGSMCDPANAAQLGEQVNRMFADFAASGPTAKELQNAKLQIANNLDTELREPRYWMGVLRHLDLHQRSLEEEKRHQEAFNRLTAEQVQQAFKKYYTPQRSFVVTSVPTVPSGVSPAVASPAEEPAPAPTPAAAPAG